MERVKSEGGDLSNGYWGEQIGNETSPQAAKEDVEEVKMTNDNVKEMLTVDELRKHYKEESPWFVVNGEVYDGTPFLKDHPGGGSSIVAAAGLDSTDEFMAIRG